MARFHGLPVHRGSLHPALHIEQRIPRIPSGSCGRWMSHCIGGRVCVARSCRTNPGVLTEAKRPLQTASGAHPPIEAWQSASRPRARYDRFGVCAAIKRMIASDVRWASTQSGRSAVCEDRSMVQGSGSTEEISQSKGPSRMLALHRGGERQTLQEHRNANLQSGLINFTD